MHYVKPESWMPADGICLEDAAKFVVESTSNMLVVAGPGAGKTELLAQRACFLLQTDICREPQKILAISFKNDAADNLKNRVKKRCGGTVIDRFISLTYDAFAKSLLDHFRNALPSDLRPNADYVVNDKAIMLTACYKAGHHFGCSDSQQMRECDMLLANTPLPLNVDTVGARVWKLLLKGFDGNRSCLSFHMIKVLAEHMIRTNPMVLGAIRATYAYVFLDEFQDTTSLQYELVRTCFLKSPAILTAVGDEKQRIMVWAGAKEDIFKAFMDEFGAMRRDLIMNHRSAPRLVQLQRMMYESLRAEEQCITCAKKWQPDDGNIKLYIADNEKSEAQAITEDIVGKINAGVSLNDICILCKQTPERYCDEIITELEGKGIKARHEAVFQDILKEPIVKVILSFMRLSLARKNPDDDEMLNELASQIFGVSISCNINKCDRWCEQFYSELDRTATKLQQCNERDIDALVLGIVEFWGKENIKGCYSVYAYGDYFDQCVEKIIQLLIEAFKTCSDWLEAIDEILGMHSIPIMTIHKSKGLEYDSVNFVGLEDGAFWNFRSRPLEERCAFFVALSRAKTNIAFTFCRNRQNLRYPHQSHANINEFFELLKKPGVAEVIGADN